MIRLVSGPAPRHPPSNSGRLSRKKCLADSGGPPSSLSGRRPEYPPMPPRRPEPPRAMIPGRPPARGSRPGRDRAARPGAARATAFPTRSPRPDQSSASNRSSPPWPEGEALKAGSGSVSGSMNRAWLDPPGYSVPTRPASLIKPLWTHCRNGASNPPGETDRWSKPGSKPRFCSGWPTGKPGHDPLGNGSGLTAASDWIKFPGRGFDAPVR